MLTLGQFALLEVVSPNRDKKSSAENLDHTKTSKAFPATTHPAAALTDLHLNEGRLVGQGSRDHPGVTEARPQERGHGKEEENRCEHGDGWRELDCQVPTPAGKQKAPSEA